MPDGQTRLQRAIRRSEELTATDNRISHLSFDKTQKGPKIAAAQETAHEAATEAGRANERLDGSDFPAAGTVADLIDKQQRGELGRLDLSEYYPSEQGPDGSVGFYMADLLVKSGNIQRLLADKVDLTSSLSWPGGVLDNTGMRFSTGSNDDENTDSALARKISALAGRLAIGFFQTSNYNNLRLDSAGDASHAGRLQLLARNGPNAGTLATGTANVRLESSGSGRGSVTFSNTDVRVGNADIEITGTGRLRMVDIPDTVIAREASWSFNHNLGLPGGGKAGHFSASYTRSDAVEWRPLAHQVGGVRIYIYANWIEFFNDNSVAIRVAGSIGR